MRTIRRTNHVALTFATSGGAGISLEESSNREKIAVEEVEVMKGRGGEECGLRCNTLILSTKKAQSSNCIKE